MDSGLGEALGYARGMRVWFHNLPDDVRAAIDPDALGLDEQPAASDGLNAAHLFCRERHRLEREAAAVAELLQTNGFLWVSWPASGDTDLNADAVREIAGSLGLAAGEQRTIGDWPSLRLTAVRNR